jgi:hypothetical protein
MNRRRFLKTLAGLTTIVNLPSMAFADEKLQGNATMLTLSIDPNTSLPTIPSDFIGLSYESAQLANPGFFSPANEDLVRYFRSLSHHGVLRIGGNTSEYSDWNSADLSHPENTLISSPNTGVVGSRTSTTSNAISNLAGFLKATGWKAIYGLNLGTGTPSNAADEAAFVAATLGSDLLAFQIGNEPDMFDINNIRTTGYSFEDYLHEWHDFADCVRIKVPQASFAGPDAAYKLDWVESFAREAKGEFTFLSSHYYAEGPPSDPTMDISRLLFPNANLVKIIGRIREIILESGLPYRMTEGNSCYFGGKDGVSNTFASALWGGDYTLQIMQGGFSGVNFHGGGNGLYTPIAGGHHQGFSARPLYYGMLLASQFVRSTMVASNLSPSIFNITAYAAKKHRQLLVAIFNKDSAPVSVSIPSGAQKASISRLSAPSLDSKEQVTFAGNPVSPNGVWVPLINEVIGQRRGNFVIDMDGGSAALAIIDS